MGVWGLRTLAALLLGYFWKGGMGHIETTKRYSDRPHSLLRTRETGPKA